MTEQSPQPRLPTVAIVGATGHLGQHITSALVSPETRPLFSQVILLSRHPSWRLSSWQDSADATIRIYDENNLAASFTGVDVLINAIGPSGHDFKDRLLRALPDSSVKIYFPSEFGVDHYVHDFPHPEWDRKKAHFALAQRLLPGVKICRVYIGLFLEDSIGPWFGFDTKAGRYESVGNAGTPVSFTALADVGRAVARLAALRAEEVPREVHIAGDTVSMTGVAEVMGSAGAGEIEVTEVDLEAFKKRTVEEGGTEDPSQYLRFLMGEGKVDHSDGGIGCDNELINPGERYWRWRTVGDLARETGGRPWADAEWPPK
ncbi:hypothetical protein H2201_005576 [Coniosporium apollinis]|uniref:NmrA-like domain-containing protein n=1 Tax=Coniosporium apollinis TaxID=61459 RepID=A0ABQ9NPL0_9PEZI|nr:hypothetical protein H2201_005576 [Coniosporium apollinis]